MLPDGAFLPFTKDGRARVLATSGEKRSPFYPDAATFAEQGVKDIVVTEWFGIFAPPATPPAIVNRASDAIAKGADRQGDRRGLRPDRHGAQVLTPAKLAAMIKVEAATWGPIIRSTGFKPLE